MGNALTPISRISAVGLALIVLAFTSEAAFAGQGSPCRALPGEFLAAHTGETPIFSGNDYNDHIFTLTQDKKTGAWALWMITDFKKEAGGLEVGQPCIVAAGKASKVLDIGASAKSAASDSPPEMPDSQTVVAEAAAEPAADVGPEVTTAAASDVETYRVTGIDDGKVLDLRSGPGTDFPTIVPIPPDGSGVTVGSCKKVQGYRHQWCATSWEGRSGWASACCLASTRTGRKLD